MLLLDKRKFCMKISKTIGTDTPVLHRFPSLCMVEFSLSQVNYILTKQRHIFDSTFCDGLWLKLTNLEPEIRNLLQKSQTASTKLTR